MFQFTPARGGRQAAERAAVRETEVQFTAARGGRRTQYGGRFTLYGFNSRPHVAGDASRSPARPFRDGFNSRPHVAGDRARTRGGLRCPRFNSRPHVAGDPRRSCRRTCHGSFNSRPHVAGDLTVAPLGSPWHTFQFTPARGGRLRPQALRRRAAEVSIHARTWRATLMAAQIARPASFNSRPHVAGDSS